MSKPDLKDISAPSDPGDLNLPIVWRNLTQTMFLSWNGRWGMRNGGRGSGFLQNGRRLWAFTLARSQTH